MDMYTTRISNLQILPSPERIVYSPVWLPSSILTMQFQAKKPCGYWLNPNAAVNPRVLSESFFKKL